MNFKHILSVTFLLLAFQFSLGQREFGTNDSTFHPLNADTTIVAGRYSVYFQTQGGLTLNHSFPLPGPSYFIRDFDLVSPDKWYVVLGVNYFGAETFLFKTTDRGTNWVIDSSFYPATINHSDQNSINNLQAFGPDTLFIFNGYYQSGIIYSLDGGDNWTHWFQNVITNYRGIFQCHNDFYLYGYEGDGFPGSMFKIPGSKLFYPDSTGVWDQSNGSCHPPCHNSAPGCILVPNSLNLYSQYLFFRNYLDSICALALPVTDPEPANQFRLFPVPTSQQLQVIPGQAFQYPAQVLVTNGKGEIVFVREIENEATSEWRFDVAELAPGVYFMEIRNAFGERSVQRFLVQ